MSDSKKSETNKLRVIVPVTLTIEIPIEVDLGLDAEALPNDGKRADLDLLSETASKYILPVTEATKASREVWEQTYDAQINWAIAYKRHYPDRRVTVRVLTHEQVI